MDSQRSPIDELVATVATLEMQKSRADTKVLNQKRITQEMQLVYEALKTKKSEFVYQGVPNISDEKQIAVEMNEFQCETRPQLERLRRLKERASVYADNAMLEDLKAKKETAENALNEMMIKKDTLSQKLDAEIISLNLLRRTIEIDEALATQHAYVVELGEQLAAIVANHQVIEREAILQSIRSVGYTKPEDIFEQARLHAMSIRSSTLQ